MPIVCLVTKVSLLLEVWFSRGFFVLFSNVTQLPEGRSGPFLDCVPMVGKLSHFHLSLLLPLTFTQLLMSWDFLLWTLPCLGPCNPQGLFKRYLLLEVKSSLSPEYFMGPLTAKP